MQLRVGGAVSILVGRTIQPARIESFNGFSAVLVLSDGTRVNSVDLNKILPPVIEGNDSIIDPRFGNRCDAGNRHDQNNELGNRWRRDAHFSSILKSQLIAYKLKAAVKSTTIAKFRILKEAVIFQDDFSSNDLTTNWKYIAGTSGWTITGGNLVNAGSDVGNAIAPNHVAAFWYSHGFKFTAVTTTGNFQAAAGIDGGVLYINFVGGSHVDMVYVGFGDPPMTIETVTITDTITTDDVVTLFSFERIIQIRKNGSVVAQFTGPTPGAVNTPWGFGDTYPITIDDFSLVGKAQETGWLLPLHYTLHGKGSPYGHFDPGEWRRVGDLDSNKGVLQAINHAVIAYTVLDRPTRALPLVYKLLGASVIKSSSIRYKLDSSVIKAAKISYGVKQPVTEGSDIIFKIKQRVTSNALILYKLKVPVTSAATVVYRVNTSVSKSDAVSYALTGNVVSSLPVLYGIGSGAGRFLTEIASMNATLAHTIIEVASMSQIVAESITEKANVAALANQSLTEKANMAGAVGQNITEKANMAATLGKSIVEFANMSVTVAKQLTEQSNMLATQGKNITEEANMNSTVFKTLTEKANMQQVAFQTTTEKANMQQVATQTITEFSDINVTVGASIVSVASVIGTNLLLNADLDVDTNADGTPDSWASETSSGTATFAGTTAFYGTRGQKIANSGFVGAGDFADISQVINVTPGDPFALSAYIDTVSLTNTKARLQVQFKNSTGGIIMSQNTDVTNINGAYNRYNTVGTVPALAVTARVVLMLVSTLAGGSGEVWFDGIKYEKSTFVDAFEGTIAKPRQPITSPITNIAGWNASSPTDFRPQNRTAKVGVSTDGTKVAIVWQHNDTGTDSFNGQPHMYVTVGDPNNPGTFTAPLQVATQAVVSTCGQNDYNVNHNQGFILGKNSNDGFMAFGMEMNANGYATCTDGSNGNHNYYISETATLADTFPAATVGTLNAGYATSSISEVQGECDGNGNIFIGGQGHLQSGQGGMCIQIRLAGQTNWTSKALTTAFRPSGSVYYFCRGGIWVDKTVNNLGNYTVHAAWAWNDQGLADSAYGLYYLQSKDKGATWQNVSGTTISVPMTYSTTAGSACENCKVEQAVLSSTTAFAGGSNYGVDGISVCGLPDGTPVILLPIYTGGRDSNIQMRYYYFTGGAWHHANVGGSVPWDFASSKVVHNTNTDNINIVLLNPGSTSTPGVVTRYVMSRTNMNAGSTTFTTTTIASFSNSVRYTSSFQAAELHNDRLEIIVEPSYTNPGKVSPALCEAGIM